MDSQLSLFGFEEAPSDKKEEVKAKSTTKKQAAKDAAPEISLFGESVSDDVSAIENDATNDEVTEEINNDIVEQEGDVNTAASEETAFPTTENYSISEEEYQQLDENSEDEFPWDEQAIPEEEIYTDTQIENENFAADGNVEDHYTEEPTIYISEEEENEYLEPTPEFENEISDIAVEETAFNSEDEIIADDSSENTESLPEITENPIEKENHFSDTELTNEVTEIEPEYIEPFPQFESEDKQEVIEEDITEKEEEASYISDKNEEDALLVENEADSLNNNTESEDFKQEVAPEYIEPIPQFESEGTQGKFEEDLSEIEDETSDTSDKNEEDALQIENQADSLNNNNESEGFKEETEYIEPVPQFESEDKQDEIEEDIAEIDEVSNVSEIENQLEDNSVDDFNGLEESIKETEPEYIEPIPQFESEDNQFEIEEDLIEVEDASDKLEDENTLIETQTESDHLPQEELTIDYPAFWDEKVEEVNIPEPIVEAKDLFGETIVTPNKNTFKAGKRGRKSFKEIDAEVDLIDVPEDDLLFSKQYYPISEVAKWFRVNNSLLRFWENEFDILKPRKNRKGDRLFRPEDIKNLQVIYYLLRNKKYTIEGAKKYLKTNKKTADINLQIIHALNNFKSFLLELKVNAS